MPYTYDDDGTAMTLYEALVADGATIDHHESDLYVKDEPFVRRILASFGKRSEARRCRLPATAFMDNIDGELWWEVAFHYDPFWADRRT